MSGLVDNIVDIKEYNQRNINALLEQLSEVIKLYNAMRGESVELENCLCQVLEILEIGGDAALETAVNLYNTFLCKYYKKLCLLSSTKVKNVDGFAKKLIADWTETNKATKFRISFRESEFRWVKCKEVCAVDNMKLCKDFNPCAAANYPINIGCNTLTFSSLVAGTSFTANMILNDGDSCSGTYTNLTASFNAGTHDKSTPITASDLTFTILDSSGTVLSI